MRLDKFLTKCTLLSRSEAKKVIKKGIIVNDIIVKDISFNVNENEDKVYLNDKLLTYSEYIYIMLNKPQGVLTATEDKHTKTVVDLLKDEDKILKPFSVGRLDKDTEGLILLTNDGELSHSLISPKKDIDKTYYVEVMGVLDSFKKELFLEGIVIDDGYKCKPAKLDVIESRDNNSKAYITISEGKFHQIKRMMKAVDCRVTYLKRLSIGKLVLDEDLKLGEYRYLTDDEINNLKNKKLGGVI